MKTGDLVTSCLTNSRAIFIEEFEEITDGDNFEQFVAVYWLDSAELGIIWHENLVLLEL